MRFEKIDDAYLKGMYIDFVDRGSADLVGRWSSHLRWWNGRLAHNIDPYAKWTLNGIHADATTCLRNGQIVEGINFASQEYLNLASHPDVHAAAKQAIDAYGVHSAGSTTLMGQTRLSRELEERLSAFLGYRDCTVFPTGWGAGYGVIKALVTENDHVVIDVLAHACLQEGARNATDKIHTFPHLSLDGVRRRLERIRNEDPRAGILVVTETVFSMDSDVPDIGAMQDLCNAYGATLLVDAAHDIGAIGPTGRGYLELQGRIGVPDILMGSFSKTFASNGGFVASNNPALKIALYFNAGPLTFTNALSPMACAVVLKCLDIIESEEGAALREKLMANIIDLRHALQAAGFELLGGPSAIVPAVLGDTALSRLMTRYTLEAGAIVNLVEYPAVSRNSSRWRLQVMALHERRHIDRLVAIALKARETAQAHLAALTSERDMLAPEPEAA